MTSPFKLDGCSNCCTPDPCSECSGTPPEQYQVDIAGIVAGTCANCDNLNGTYVLTNHSTSRCCFGYPTEACFEFSPSYQTFDWCDGVSNSIRLTLYFASGNKVRVSLYVKRGLYAAIKYVWKATLESKPSCSQAALDLPFSEEDSSAECTAADATCTVTAL